MSSLTIVWTLIHACTSVVMMKSVLVIAATRVCHCFGGTSEAHLFLQKLNYHLVIADQTTVLSFSSAEGTKHIGVEFSYDSCH